MKKFILMGICMLLSNTVSANGIIEGCQKEINNLRRLLEYSSHMVKLTETTNGITIRANALTVDAENKLINYRQGSQKLPLINTLVEGEITVDFFINVDQNGKNATCELVSADYNYTSADTNVKLIIQESSNFGIDCNNNQSLFYYCDLARISGFTSPTVVNNK